MELIKQVWSEYQKEFGRVAQLTELTLIPLTFVVGYFVAAALDIIAHN